MSINVWSDVNQFRFVRFSSFSTEIEILRRRLELYRVGCLKMHDNCCQAYFPFLWIMYPEYAQHNHCLTRIWLVVRDYRQKKLACCLSAFGSFWFWDISVKLSWKIHLSHIELPAKAGGRIGHRDTKSAGNLCPYKCFIFNTYMESLQKVHIDEFKRL